MNNQPLYNGGGVAVVNNIVFDYQLINNKFTISVANRTCTFYLFKTKQSLRVIKGFVRKTFNMNNSELAPAAKFVLSLINELHGNAPVATTLSHTAQLPVGSTQKARSRFLPLFVL